MTKRLLLTFFAVTPLWAQTLTTVAETTFSTAVGGTLFRGYIDLELPRACRLSLSGQAYARSKVRLCVGTTGSSCTTVTAAGAFSIGLVPTAAGSGVTPAGCYYNARIEPRSGTVSTGEAYTETWDIPATGPVDVDAVRVSVIPTPSTVVLTSQLKAPGVGCLEADVNGVVVPTGSACGGSGGVSDGDKGDIVVSAGGTVYSIDAGVVVNTDINASAAIALTKLAATTASRALVSDASGFIVPATTTAAEIGFINGLTSAVQTQLDAKAPLASPTFTGVPAAPTPLTTDDSTALATTAFVKAQGYLSSNLVSSVFGRTGAVAAQSGDYSASQVTNAVDSTSTYSNPAWITALAYAKITGAPVLSGDCDNATTSKVLYDLTTNTFSCGTDQAGGGGVSDGDKGAIVVSVSGTVWDIDTGVIVNSNINAGAAIALSKLATQADQTFVGNVSGGAAVPIALTATQVKTNLAIACSDLTDESASCATDATNASNIGSGTLPTGRIAGSYTGITGVGTIAAGTWQGTAIADTYIASAATWNAKEEALTFSSPLSRSVNTVSCPTCGLTGSSLAQFASTTSAQLAGVLSNETGTGLAVFNDSPAFITPNLGTPSAATLTNATGLPISTGVAGLGTGIATALATPSSSNLATAVTDETGSGALVFATSPVLTTPNLGTPSAAVLTNATGTAAGLTVGAASALAANPADCLTARTYGTTIAANGDLTCAGTPQIFNWTLDGGGSVLTAAVGPTVWVRDACTIDLAMLNATDDLSGSVTVIIEKADYTTGAPSWSTISSSFLLSSGRALKDSTLSGWTTSVAADSWLRVSITGTPATITKAAVSLRCI